MGIVDWLKKWIVRVGKEETISDTKRVESIPSESNRYESIPNDTNRYESIDTTIRIDESVKQPFISKETEDKKALTIEKESLQLGVAAGYISRSLLDIEDSLKRIEMLMTTRDWISLNLMPKIEQMNSTINQLKEIISKHETNEEKRFQIILEAIHALKSIEPSLPAEAKVPVLSTIESLKKAALTPKMEQIIQIVKETGEISYTELSQKLQISVDSLRGILSKMSKITDEIERFEREGKGWVRYKSIRIDTNRLESSDTSKNIASKIDNKKENLEEW